MNKPYPDDRIVKTIVQNVCGLADVPPNETLFNCNIPHFRFQQIEKQLRDAFGLTVQVEGRDTVFTITNKLKQVIQ